jgi:hypothetical protein
MELSCVQEPPSPIGGEGSLPPNIGSGGQQGEYRLAGRYSSTLPQSGTMLARMHGCGHTLR